MNLKQLVPNSITLLNLALGFTAILINDPFLSPVLILGGGIADLFDGLAARLLKVNSTLGLQLDSLADLVSFGVAPAFLYYHHIMPESVWSLLVVVLIPVFSAFRLARFNIDESQQSSFLGLATPSSGFFFTFIVFGWTGHELFVSNPWLVYLLPVLFSMLMVLPVRMFSLKGFTEKPPVEKIIVGLVVISGMVLMLFYQLKAIPLIVLTYVGLCFVNNLIKLKDA